MENQQARGDSLYHMVKELLRLRRQEDAFAVQDNLKLLWAQKDRRAFAYGRGDLVMLCNPSGRAEEIGIEIPARCETLFAVGGGHPGQKGYLLEAQSFVILRKPGL